MKFHEIIQKEGIKAFRRISWKYEGYVYVDNALDEQYMWYEHGHPNENMPYIFNKEELLADDWVQHTPIVKKYAFICKDIHNNSVRLSPLYDTREEAKSVYRQCHTYGEIVEVEVEVGDMLWK